MDNNTSINSNFIKEIITKDLVDNTKKEVENMRNKGIKILSYFISEREDKELSRDFKIMYGSDSANVSVNSLLPLAKTLNKMFIEKNLEKIKILNGRKTHVRVSGFNTYSAQYSKYRAHLLMKDK